MSSSPEATKMVFGVAGKGLRITGKVGDFAKARYEVAFGVYSATTCNHCCWWFSMTRWWKGRVVATCFKNPLRFQHVPTVKEETLH